VALRLNPVQVNLRQQLYEVAIPMVCGYAYATPLGGPSACLFLATKVGHACHCLAHRPDSTGTLSTKWVGQTCPVVLLPWSPWFSVYSCYFVAFGLVCTTCLLFIIGVPAASGCPLPVDQSLSIGNSSGTGLLMSATTGLQPNLYSSPTSTKLPTVVVAEGVPPVSCRLIEKIRKLEFIHMADLLKENSGRVPQFMVVNGQLVAVQSHVKSRTPLTILKWLQAFNILMAVVLSCEETSKKEEGGLAAHAFLIVQLSEDLQGPQWLHYDQNFREWAAAEGLRKSDIRFQSYIVEGITLGFRIGFDRSHSLHYATKNLHSSNPAVISEHPEREVCLNRTWKFPINKCSPGFHVSPVGAIPKKNKPDNWHLIVYLSSPSGSSVNDGMEDLQQAGMMETGWFFNVPQQCVLLLTTLRTALRAILSGLNHFLLCSSSEDSVGCIHFGNNALGPLSPLVEIGYVVYNRFLLVHK